MYDDAKFIRDFVAGLDEDVVIMGHSYGGKHIPIQSNHDLETSNTCNQAYQPRNA